jgi:hypothetical protein
MLNRQEYPSLMQGLIAAWCPSLGATGLTLLDRSGRNNHGTLTNMGGQDNWRASGSGVALNFDGVDDYVATNVSLEGAFTVSIWANKRTAGAAGERILWGNTADNDTYIADIASTYVYVQSDTNGQGKQFLGLQFAINEWFHLVIQRDLGNGVRVYKNGVESTSGSQSVAGTFSLNALGRYASAATFNWDGYIDDIRVYDRTITIPEIRPLSFRRGIGLSPLTDRAAGLPRKLSVNVGGTSRPSDAYINVGGTWKLAQASMNVAGVWK